jgi:hypothetical protein
MNKKQSNSRVNFHHTTADEERKGKVYYKTPKHSYAQSKLDIGGYEDNDELEYGVLNNSRSKSYVQNKQYSNENFGRSSRWSVPSKMALNDGKFCNFDSKAKTLYFDKNQEIGKNQMESSQLENKMFVDETTMNQSPWPLNSTLDQGTSLFDLLTTNKESSKENLVDEQSINFESGSHNTEQIPIHSILHHSGEQHHPMHHIVWGENSTSDESQDTNLVHQSNPKFRPSYISQHEQHPHDEHTIYSEKLISDALQGNNVTYESYTKFKPSYVSNSQKSLQSILPDNEVQTSTNVIDTNIESSKTNESPSFFQNLMPVLVPSYNTPKSKYFESKFATQSNIKEQVQNQRNKKLRSKSTSNGSNKRLPKDVHTRKNESTKSVKSPSFVQSFMSLFQTSPKNESSKVASENEVVEFGNIGDPIKNQDKKNESFSTKVLNNDLESLQESKSPSLAQSLISLFQESPSNTSLESLSQNEKIKEETLMTNNLAQDVHTNKTRFLGLNKSQSYVPSKESKSSKLAKTLSFSHPAKNTKSPKLNKSLSFSERFMMLFQSSSNDTSTKELNQIENQIQKSEPKDSEAILIPQSKKSDCDYNASTSFLAYHEHRPVHLSTTNNDNRNESMQNELASIYTPQHQFDEYSTKNDRNIMDESRRASIEELRKELSFKLDSNHEISPYVTHQITRNHEPRRYSVDKLGNNFKELQQRSQSTSSMSRASLYSNLQRTRPKSLATSQFLSPRIQNDILEENLVDRDINDDLERNNEYGTSTRQSMHGRKREIELKNCSQQHSRIHFDQTLVDKNKDPLEDVAKVINTTLEQSINSDCQTLTSSKSEFLSSENLTLPTKDCDLNENILCIAKIRFVLDENLASHVQSI